MTVFPFSAIVGQDNLKRALLLGVIQPGLGGVLIRGTKGVAKSTAVRALAALLPPIETVAGCCFQRRPGEIIPDWPVPPDAPPLRRPVPLVELPLGATEDRLLGALHLEKALRGERAFEPGLLAAANRGILYIDEVNLLPDHLVDVLLDAAASGLHRLEREGLSLTHPARFLLVGTMNPEEGELRPQLLDRFGLAVDVADLADPADRAEAVRRRLAFEADPDAFARRWQPADAELARRIVEAQGLLPQVRISDELLSAISRRCLAAVVEGLRADLTMCQAACAWAAFHGRRAVEGPDIDAVAELALAHRRGDPPPCGPSPGGGAPTTEDGKGNVENREWQLQDRGSRLEDRGSRMEDGRSRLEDGRSRPEYGRSRPEDRRSRMEDGLGTRYSVLGTPYSVLDPPSSLLHPATISDIAGLFAAGVRPSLRPASARPGGWPGQTGTRRGSIAGLAGQGSVGGVAWAATLRRAALEQKERGRCGSGQPLILRADDLRCWRRREPAGCLLLFVIDTSGSMAAWRRMRQTKAAILALLVQAYQHRDRIALLAFRGDAAELVLPPTHGIKAARRALEDLPTGGTTPLAVGLAEARRLMGTVQRRQPGLPIWTVILTDGRANVSIRRGRRDRPGSPWQDALHQARLLSASAVEFLAVDTEVGWPRFGRAGELAKVLGARCLPLEEVLGKPLRAMTWSSPGGRASTALLHPAVGRRHAPREAAS